MPLRLRQVLHLIVGVAIGYALGSGPSADWVVDICNVLRMVWAEQRAARTGTGMLPLLVSGYLLGQGGFLLIGRVVSRMGPERARRQERLSVWDPSLHLASRFGMQLYLERCTAWAAEDPTARTQTVAMFKIHGLEALNAELGTLPATQLLLRLSAELRSATLQEQTSRVVRWFRHHFDRIQSPEVTQTRYAARWSGATFALAFRELDATQAISIAREIAGWIQHEIGCIDCSARLRASCVVAVGTAGVAGLGLVDAAQQRLVETSDGLMSVLVDPADFRAPSIEQMSGLELVKVQLARAGADVGHAHKTSGDLQQQIRQWLGSWGPPIALVGAAMVVFWSAGIDSIKVSAYPWTSNVTEIQVVDQAGAKSIGILHTNLPDQSNGRWRLTEASIAQADRSQGVELGCHVHVKVTNLSEHTYYVSAFDFAAIDADGNELLFDARRAFRFSSSVTGRWLRPGESLSGWLMSLGQRRPIVGLVFQPDRMTRIEARSSERLQ